MILRILSVAATLWLAGFALLILVMFARDVIGVPIATILHSGDEERVRRAWESIKFTIAVLATVASILVVCLDLSRRKP